jgi:hypothetical protein
VLDLESAEFGNWCTEVPFGVVDDTIEMRWDRGGLFGGRRLVELEFTELS